MLALLDEADRVVLGNHAYAELSATLAIRSRRAAARGLGAGRDGR